MLNLAVNIVTTGLLFFVFPVALRPNAGHGLLIIVSKSHTAIHHSRWDSSRQVISPSQRPLPDNTQHSQQTSTSPAGFEPTTPVDKRPQTYALDRAATGTDKMQRYEVYFIWKLLYMFRVVPLPIIRSANNCIYSIWYLSHRYCYLPLSWKSCSNCCLRS